tara:strand:+ start:217 stop:447 length:231 start_codon:yes stop_codon:yes gene_type:complete
MLDIKKLVELLDESGYEGDLEIDNNKSFKDNGIDSLDVFSWLSTIESDVGISISDEDLPEIKTPNMLLDYINKKLK